MYDGCNIFTKEEINVENVAKQLDIKIADILYINSADDWLKKKNEIIAIENNGILDSGSNENYNGCYYYAVTFFKEGLKDKLIKLSTNDFIVDIE